jgi:YebC/PmpR family DNA-binding regulatory protein
MSGHSKWATIKHKKAATDAKRGKIFTRLIREIQVAAREGGADQDANPRLRTAVAAAKAQSMPGENIKRAILRGSGQLEGQAYSEITFEGYATAGVAVLIETVTDNRNRTVAALRHIFAKNGGNLGENGCVSWMFHQQSLIVVPKAATDEEELMDIALMSGADDLREDGEHWAVYSPPSAHGDVLGAIRGAGIEPLSAEVSRIPENTVRVAGKQAGSVIRMIEKLEDQDDVQNVFANFDIDERELEALSA